MKASAAANKFRRDGEEYGVKPEVLAHISAKNEWNEIERQMRELRKGPTADFSAEPLRQAIDKLVESVLGLKVLVKERFGE